MPGLQQDIYRNQYAGVSLPGWAGNYGPDPAGHQFSGTLQPWQNVGLPGGPPHPVSSQDAPSGALPPGQDATPGNQVPGGSGGTWSAVGTPPATGPSGGGGTPGGTPPAAPPSTAPPVTPNLAPTSAQVSANPSAYAGTSFDPALRISGVPPGPGPGANWGGGTPDPQYAAMGANDPHLFNTYSPGAGASPGTPQWVIDSIAASGPSAAVFPGSISSPEGVFQQQQLQSGGIQGPVPLPTRAQGIAGLGLQPTGDPNTFITAGDGTYNPAPPHNGTEAGYQAWMQRMQQPPNPAHLTALLNM